MQRAFETCFHHLASLFERLVYVAVEVVVVRRAAARTMVASKARIAFLAGEQTRIFENRANLRIDFSLKNVAHKELRVI